MDFSLNDDQLAIASELDKLAAQFAQSPVDFHGFALVSDALDQQLEEMAAAKRQLMELRAQVRSVRDNLPA